ncbi:MAG: hypothetical protein WC480_01625 [Patescibacteria group bacterium]
MPKCRDCKHFRPKDSERGDCHGYEVLGEIDADLCPTSSYMPLENEENH